MPLDPVTSLLAIYQREDLLRELARAPEATEAECRAALWGAGLCPRCAQQRAAAGATLCPACAEGARP